MKTHQNARNQYIRVYETRNRFFLGFGISGTLAGLVGTVLSVTFWVMDVPYHPGIHWLAIISLVAVGLSLACFLQAWDARTKVRRLNREGQWKQIVRDFLLQKNTYLVWMVVGWPLFVAGIVYMVISDMRSSSDSTNRSVESFFTFTTMTLVQSFLAGAVIGTAILYLMMVRDTVVFRKMLNSEAASENVTPGEPVL